MVVKPAVDLGLRQEVSGMGKPNCPTKKQERGDFIGGLRHHERFRRLEEHHTAFNPIEHHIQYRTGQDEGCTVLQTRLERSCNLHWASSPIMVLHHRFSQQRTHHVISSLQLRAIRESRTSNIPTCLAGTNMQDEAALSALGASEFFATARKESLRSVLLL
ncbi:hypothetical protein IFR05_011613 [Cadophora sp. M221]|nr:hypothetical protein IFR05_011613 [Cadophora sp. M221]